MIPSEMFTWGVVGLLLARAGMELFLELCNQRYVRAHAQAVPEPLHGIIDPATFSKSIDYTLAKSRLSQAETVYDSLVLAIVLFSGILPWSYQLFTSGLGASVWVAAAWIMSVGITLSLVHLPFGWYEQFRLEERFGFNTTTRRLWWTDRLKGALIALLLGYPLLLLILKLVEWTGSIWWLWAWIAVFGFQLVLIVLAPLIILPLFNKFTPLPDGALRDQLLALAGRTGFPIQSIQVMDGSKRSRHSNAFFTGFGRFRKVVLFDTLVQQLSVSELESVLAHEIGHYKKRHIPKLMMWSAISLLVSFYAISWLARQDWFYQAFGMPEGQIGVALLLFGLLSRTVMFWFAPLANLWSRRYEYQADRFALEVMEEGRSLIGALRKLSEKNLSNLTPHPLYSRFYYSHPTLLEREQAIETVYKLRGTRHTPQAAL